MKSNFIPKLLFFFFSLLILSCSKTEENTPLEESTGEITVEKLVRKCSLRNQSIPFSVIDDNGVDHTEEAVFYVNGDAIEGNVFSSDVTGTYQVYAVYMDGETEITTNTEDFYIIIPKQKVVVEDYTGTWCGYCPAVAAAVEMLREETQDIAVVAIHQTSGSHPDPMHFPEVEELKTEFGVDGLPAARVNRTVGWSLPFDISEVLPLAGQETNLAIAINSQLDGNNLTVQVDVVYENGSVTGDKLVVYLVEDDIIADQTNYYDTDPTSPFYQMGNPIPNFVHKDVLRKSISNLFGDAITATPALEEFSKTLSVSIESDYAIDKLRIVAMVVDENNTARNAQFASINEDKCYE